LLWIGIGGLAERTEVKKEKEIKETKDQTSNSGGGQTLLGFKR
jgi:hypothetical protein